MDISGFFNDFLSMIVDWFSWSYGTLDKIKFNGVSLLDFSITLLLLSVVVPLVITLTKSRSFNEVSFEKRYEKQERIRRKVRNRLDNEE